MCRPAKPPSRGVLARLVARPLRTAPRCSAAFSAKARRASQPRKSNAGACARPQADARAWVEGSRSGARSNAGSAEDGWMTDRRDEAQTTAAGAGENINPSESLRVASLAAKRAKPRPHPAPEELTEPPLDERRRAACVLGDLQEGGEMPRTLHWSTVCVAARARELTPRQRPPAPAETAGAAVAGTTRTDPVTGIRHVTPLGASCAGWRRRARAGARPLPPDRRR